MNFCWLMPNVIENNTINFLSKSEIVSAIGPNLKHILHIHKKSLEHHVKLVKL